MIRFVLDFSSRAYTGSALVEAETLVLKSCPKNLRPVAPPGTMPSTMKSNAIICATANSTVNAVLLATKAQYRVNNRQELYDMEVRSLGFENICRRKAPNPDRKQKLRIKNRLPRV